MSIESIGSMKNILNSYNSQDWTKSSDVKLKGLTPESFLKVSEGVSSSNSPNFSDMLAKSILEVNDLQKEANHAVEKLATGKSKNIHETMLAVEKADIAFKTMNQVRQKVIDAYKEIMRMQV